MGAELQTAAEHFLSEEQCAGGAAARREVEEAAAATGISGGSAGGVGDGAFRFTVMAARARPYEPAPRWGEAGEAPVTGIGARWVAGGDGGEVRATVRTPEGFRSGG